MADYEQSAFPVEHRMHDHGMTLRDYFAAKAMQAISGNVEMVSAISKEYGSDADNIAARMSYEMADAMMKERAK